MTRVILCISLCIGCSFLWITSGTAQSMSTKTAQSVLPVEYVPWNNDPLLPAGLYFVCDDRTYLVNRVREMGKNQLEGGNVNYAVDRADRRVGCRPQTIKQPEEKSVLGYVSSHDGFQVAIWRVRQFGFLYFVAQPTGRLAGQVEPQRQPSVICGPLVRGMSRAQVQAWYELCG